MGRSSLLVKLIAFRIINALLCQTFFQPDEYYQSLEIAHRIVFGYGWRTWEWRGDSAIRSAVLPLIFTPAYWAVQKLGLEDTYALIAAPKLVQAVISAVGDYYTAQLASTLFPGQAYRNVALFCSLVSFSNGGISIRTFSNSIETTLTAAALSKWPWSTTSGYGASLWLAGFACVLRPTNALIWIYLALAAIARGRSYTVRLITHSFLPVFGCVAVCAATDAWYYGRRTFTPYNFYQTNLVSKISFFYGANPWHFYLTQALPFDTVALLPFVVYGSYLSFRRTDWPSAVSTARNVSLWTVGCLSLVSHKEFRFIQPLLPICHVLAAAALIQLGKRSEIGVLSRRRFLPVIRSTHLWSIAVLNTMAILVFIVVHMRGQVSVTRYLHSLPSTEVKSVGFLMPCHSTPWQSHIHLPQLEVRGIESGYGGRLWALTCEPPLGQDATGYQDETKLFYADPFLFVDKQLPRRVDTSFPSAGNLDYSSAGLRRPWPSHLVLFDALLRHPRSSGNGSFSELLFSKGYIEQKRIWNSWLHEDPDRAGNIVVLRHASVVRGSE